MRVVPVHPKRGRPLHMEGAEPEVLTTPGALNRDALGDEGRHRHARLNGGEALRRYHDRLAPVHAACSSNASGCATRISSTMAALKRSEVSRSFHSATGSNAGLPSAP